MRKPLPFYIVDVFAENKYEGNQLAVVRGASSLTTEEMQQITKEMNYSETTFILSDEPNNGGYDVRIFTPGEEVPFAGHPTLGTAYIIQQEIKGGSSRASKELTTDYEGNIVLNLKVGQIPVSFQAAEPSGHSQMLWMKQNAPKFGRSFEPQLVAQAIGVDAADIDARFPIHEVSTGLPSIIVPLRDLASVKKSKVNKEHYSKLMEIAEAKVILVFCPETYHAENQLNVRVFVDSLGVPEDPATGSANGNLAGYLIRNRFFGSESIDIRVEQGYEIGRPSLLYLKAAQGETAINVQVGGKVAMIARGELV